MVTDSKERKKAENENEQQDPKTAAVQEQINNLKFIYKRNRKKFPKNILLVGRPSAGKSSLVNLFRAALAGHYEEIARVGSVGEGCGVSVTDHLLFYTNMGLTDEEFENFKKEHDLQDEEDFSLPTIVDMPGMDPKQMDVEKVLKYVIDGVVSSEVELASPLFRDTAISKLTSNQKDWQERKIDRVIFVVNVTQDIPYELFDGIMKLVCHAGGRQRVIPYLLLFTHVDCVSKDGDGDEGAVRAETAEARKKNAAKVLEMENNLRLKSHEIVSYSNRDDYDDSKEWRYKTDLEKHESALKAMCKIFTGTPVIDEKFMVSKNEQIKDGMKRWMTRWKAIGHSVLRSFFFVLAIILLLMIPVILTQIQFRDGNLMRQFVNISKGMFHTINDFVLNLR